MEVNIKTYHIIYNMSHNFNLEDYNITSSTQTPCRVEIIVYYMTSFLNVMILKFQIKITYNFIFKERYNLSYKLEKSNIIQT